MLNRSASLAMSTSVFKAFPGKLDIKRQSPSILYTHKPMNCIQNRSFIGMYGFTQDLYIRTTTRFKYLSICDLDMYIIIVFD